ncbi:TRAP transporter substrate-binding protein [Salinicola rhizosphaerae]|uniref:C4-dicarboxylate ABC transporter n=1 Tax=Salinicola rhizosphaerae TaxID=1443141 RepID=A0ABQ3DQG8_9GAMM|nr:TRAP transporter substrate-binding protein [Salinicola rhizosphaerae]GHB11968.1 C4-dicarboxylate ABC transporter [Salinicola rhizosphaerae]
MQRSISTAVLAAISAALISGAVQADTWRMATKMPVDSPEGQLFEHFAERVDQYTDGDLTIQVFPNEQLGKEDAVLEQLQSGVVDIYAEGFNFMKRWEPALAWVVAPFAFDDYEHWSRFMNSDLVNGWFEEAARKSGIVPLGDPSAVIRGPYRVLVSSTPVESIDDVDGLKMRMPSNQLLMKVWDNLGAQVMTLPWTEVYQSISKNIVQAVTTPVSMVESMRFKEVAPYLARTNEYYQSIGFMTNQAALEGLDDDTRVGLMRAYRETAKESHELLAEVTRKSLARMKKDGLSYTELDTQPFIERTQKLYQQMDADGDLPEGFLETVKATRQPAE